MSRPATLRAIRVHINHIRQLSVRIRRVSIRQQLGSSPVSSIRSSVVPRALACRSFHSSRVTCIDLTGDADKETLKESEPHENPSHATPLSQREYEVKAEEFFNTLVEKLENMQSDDNAFEDVEYSSGVLTIKTNGGTYVLNKQPPNKQIWLSSPISGPKHFDWVVLGESMNQKEGTGREGWICVKDNTELSDLLQKELNVSDEPSDGIDII